MTKHSEQFEFKPASASESLRKFGDSLLSAGGISIEQVSELEQIVNLVEELESENVLDRLTGVYNNKYLYPGIVKSVRTLRRHTQNSFALAVIDIDNFKPINDTLGHHAGDEVLKYVASGLVANMRSSDIVFRTGGDEFVAYVDNVTPSGGNDLKTALGRLIAPFSESVTVDNQELKIDASLGYHIASSTDLVAISLGNPETVQNTIDNIINHADKYMYHQKALRKN